MSNPDAATLRLTEQRNPNSTEIDRASAIEIVRIMLREDATVPGLVAAAELEIARAISLVEAALRRGGRLIYVGAGTSGRLGVLDASECPPTFDSSPGQVLGIIAGGPEALVTSQEGVEDDTAAGRRVIQEVQISERDVVVGIAASGVTPFVHAALAQAASQSAKTILLCCAPPPENASRRVDITICIATGPEVVTGSTRLKAGTATKLVLNMMSTGAMIRLGKTYGNLMVDLQARSAKLRERGERIVMEVTGLDRERATAAIAAASGSVRTAIVMIVMNLGLAEAKQALEQHQQRLRPLLGDPPEGGG